MKIIYTSNFSNDAVKDCLLLENLHPWVANWIVTEMQRQTHELDMYWPIVVEDDYRLWRGMEELV
ncbi:hypothetical protein [Methylocystis hirsuta]|uniref:Uncharacterized protein n=1 Tax=Methylocystis hirsuta TaxID=369798 RepID=A0A3M9XNK6_9HYPH|nr:hypothetical protein [Methylocystis hirsuta]RNJ49425.1 hypothetical protein D1O30_07210 [Methylocystis hirsuta]